MSSMKILGQRKIRTPVENAKAAARLIRELEKTRPYKKPRGLILRFRNWSDLAVFNRERAAKLIERT